MSNWSAEWPKKPGVYWFFGWRSLSAKKSEAQKLLVVKVIKIASGTAYISDGAFLYATEGAEGVWQPMITPETPEVGQHYYRGLEVSVPDPFNEKKNIDCVVSDVDYQDNKAEVNKKGEYYKFWVPFDKITVRS